MTDTPPEGRWRDLRRELEEIPQHPASENHPRRVLTRMRRGIDFIGHINFNAASFFARINPYPKPFKHIWLRAEDGVRIAGWVGPHRPTNPKPWGIVMVPGMFSTKDDTIHKRRAIRLWRDWRIPVIAIDMRGFGESSGISTAGWKEAYDVLAAAKYLREKCHVKRVAVMAESMGGAAALNAAGLDGERGTNWLSGGVLTWSAFVDSRDAVEYISARPPPEHPFSRSWSGFRRLLGMKTMGGYNHFGEYLDDAARVNGLAGVDELYEMANPKNKVRSIRTPTLAIHASNDPVVPVRHARRLERYAAGTEYVQTMIIGWGQHTSFEPMDPDWYWEVCRRWFGAVNGEKLPIPAAKRRTLRLK